MVRGLNPTPARVRHLAEIANLKDGTSFFDELRAQGYDVQEAETGNLGLYELAEQLIGLFGLLGRNGESDYLFRFLDLTLEYSLKHGNNLGQFLAEWTQRKGRISINAPAGGRAAITITTVHKAKGLAYGVVIVPFADWSLEPHRGTLLWGQLEAADKPLAEMPDVAVVSLNQTIQATALKAQYDEEQEKTFLEALNTLYVAFTRPRHRLYIVSKRPRGTQNHQRPAGPGRPPNCRPHCGRFAGRLPAKPAVVASRTTGFCYRPRQPRTTRNKKQKTRNKNLQPEQFGHGPLGRAPQAAPPRPHGV